MSLSNELHAIISALVGGLRYGLKIRLPHALVMTALFRGDLSAEQKMVTIWKLAREHATNLAAFATLYKTILALLKFTSRRMTIRHDEASKKGFFQSTGRLIISALVDGPYRGNRLVERDPGQPECYHHALVAGAMGGYFIWGRYSNVNHQIVLYLASRVLVGLGKQIAEGFNVSHYTSHSYPVFAAAIWGLVMVLFEESPHVLHSSLKKSMDEIYRYDMTSSKSNLDGSQENS